MTDNNEVFTLSAVLAAVAVELKFNLNDLAVESMAGPPVDPSEPCSQYRVVSRSTNFSVCVHRDRASAESLCRTLVGDWLAKGVFFDKMTASRELLDAVMASCKLDDLQSWLTVKAREGWVLDPLVGSVRGESRTIKSINEDRARVLAEYLRDPLNAVLRLTKGNLMEEAIAILLEQCSFDTKVMIDAIVKSQGGWEGFSYGMVAMTPEGFLIEAENEYTVEYMVRLYDSQEISGQGPSGQGPSGQ